MSTGSSNNQTLSFLLKRFAEAGIRPRTQLGQNFLTDLNLVRLLARTAELGPRDVVLEVGTGTGSLTALMAAEAAAVVTVEVDRQLFQLAGEDLAPFSNVRMLIADALKNKNCLNPEVLEAVFQTLDAQPGREFKLVANLPYHIATPLMTNLLLLDRPPKSMTVTIQKELADRLVATPATKAYGALAVWVQSQCRVEIARVMPPSVFWPRPKVTSAIVHVVLDSALRDRIPDREFFHEFVRAMFFHRRKFLRSQLLAAIKNLAKEGLRGVRKSVGVQGQQEKQRVDLILARTGYSAEIRAEELGVEELLRLAEAVREELRGASETQP